MLRLLRPSHSTPLFHTIRRPLHVDTKKGTVLPSHCQKCSALLPTCLPACPACWNISEMPQNIIYHAMFGLPYEPSPFSVDISLLKQKFRKAQSICHPDAWASQGDEKKHVAEALSAEINEAYQTLLKPLSRVEYILKRHGQGLTDAEGMGTITGVSEQDLSFLGEVMEIRTDIETADTKILEDVRVVEKIHQQNQDNVLITVRTLNELLDAFTEQAGEFSPKWDSVKRYAIRLRYLESIDKAIKKWLERVEIST